MIQFDFPNQKPITTKIGANIFERRSENFNSFQAKAAELGFQILYWNPEKPYIIIPEHHEALQNLLTASGSKLGLRHPLHEDPDFLWLGTMLLLEPEVIQLGQENLDVENSLYLSLCNSVMDYVEWSVPNQQVAFSLFPGFTYRLGQIVKDRLRFIADPANLVATDIAMDYHQLDDRVTLTEDQASNIPLIDQYCDTILPQDFIDFYHWLPNMKTKLVGQWWNFDPNNKTRPQLSPAAANYALTRVASFVLNNTDKYSYLFYMELASLFRNEAEFQSMKRIINCFKNDFVIPVTTDLEGVKIVGFSTGEHDLSMLITNNSPNTYKQKRQDIFAGNRIIGDFPFSRSSGYAETWDSEVVNDSTNERAVNIPKHSASVIKFVTQ